MKIHMHMYAHTCICKGIKSSPPSNHKTSIYMLPYENEKKKPEKKKKEGNKTK